MSSRSVGSKLMLQAYRHISFHAASAPKPLGFSHAYETAPNRFSGLGAVEVRRDQSTSEQLCCDASFSCLCGRASVQHLSYLRSNTEAITQKRRKTTCDDFLTKHLQSSVGLSTG